jgi:hypothetical protein
MYSALKLCAFLLLAPTDLIAGENFLAELEDLPLAPGLTEQPGGLLFDSANGRIVEAQASGDVTPEQVRKFYETTLTQLGWKTAGQLQYRRDDEMLKIAIDAKAKPLTVHFNLSPTR